jgi:hypothetical protein
MRAEVQSHRGDDLEPTSPREGSPSYSRRVAEGGTCFISILFECTTDGMEARSRGCPCETKETGAALAG